jgi:hypothetical protein
MFHGLNILFNKWAHIIVALISFFFVWKYFAPYPIWQATLYMAFGTFWLVDLLKVLFSNNYSMLGVYVTLFVGSILCFMFFIWGGNTLLKAFNYLFLAFNWEFRIGNLFSGIYQYIFSIPSLICGVILLSISIIWDNNVQYRLWNVFIKNHK